MKKMRGGEKGKSQTGWGFGGTNEERDLKGGTARNDGEKRWKYLGSLAGYQ